MTEEELMAMVKTQHLALGYLWEYVRSFADYLETLSPDIMKGFPKLKPIHEEMKEVLNNFPEQLR